jgi:hypothetical protein
MPIARITINKKWGDVYLIVSDSSGRIVYRNEFLFNVYNCNEVQLAGALGLIYHHLYEIEDVEKAVLDTIAACRPVMRKLKNMEIVNI